MKKLFIYLLFILIFFLVGGISFYVGQLYKTYKIGNEDASISRNQEKYSLLAKRIFLENPNDALISFTPLRKQLHDYVDPFGEDFAFYFEYLPTGVSIGINEKLEFTPLSLIKIPLAITYYYIPSRKGISIDQTVTIKKEDIDSNFGSLWKKGVGYQIDMEEAVRLALVESDNTAALVLGHNLPLEIYQEVYLGLDIPITDDAKLLRLSTKQYSSILKALYFSSILDWADSNKILNYLIESKLDNGLRSGVDSNIKVAHKVGMLAEELYQDCGIIYFPQRPYLLCMFSKSNEKVAYEKMHNVSKMVFDFVSTANHIR